MRRMNLWVCPAFSLCIRRSRLPAFTTRIDAHKQNKAMENTDYSQLTADGTVMVEFYASWCPHCKRMMTVVEDIKSLFGSQVKIYQFDIDEYQDLAGEMEVQSIPTFIIYKDGREMWRASGEMDGNVLASNLRQAL